MKCPRAQSSDLFSLLRGNSSRTTVLNTSYTWKIPKFISGTQLSCQPYTLMTILDIASWTIPLAVIMHLNTMSKSQLNPTACYPPNTPSVFPISARWYHPPFTKLLRPRIWRFILFSLLTYIQSTSKSCLFFLQKLLQVWLFPSLSTQSKPPPHLLHRLLKPSNKSYYFLLLLVLVNFHTDPYSHQCDCWKCCFKRHCSKDSNRINSKVLTKSCKASHSLTPGFVSDFTSYHSFPYSLHCHQTGFCSSSLQVYFSLRVLAFTVPFT